MVGGIKARIYWGGLGNGEFPAPKKKEEIFKICLLLLKNLELHLRVTIRLTEANLILDNAIRRSIGIQFLG